MTVMLFPPKKWAVRIHRWMWATVVIIGLIVALVDGVSRYWSN